MNPWTSAGVAAVALAGSAAMGDAECRGADWYELGFRDDVARYAQGWQEGKYEFDTRDKGPTY